MHSGIPSGGNPNPGAALNGVQLRRLVPQPPLFVDRDRLVWLSSLDATHYDVVSGDLNTLRSSGGNFVVATDPCLVDDSTALTLPQTEAPAPGEGRWFLVRGGAFTWNSPGTDQVGDRDPQLAAAGSACL